DMPAALELDVLSPGRGRQRHTLTQPCALVGRNTRANVCLNHADVSRRHVYFQVLGGRLFAVDLASRGGMTLEGVEVPSGWFGPGERLSLGPFRLEHVASAGVSPCPDPLANPMEDPGDEPEDVAAASFDISLDDRVIARWRMNRVLSLVGRSPRCRVRLR